MSTENKVAQTEELNKSIDMLLDEVFGESETAEKSLDIAKDSKTTADAAIASAPSSQNDAARGAGRPKQISDVPNNDQDGKRDSEYDAAIAQATGEVEPEEAKKQAKAIDQVSKEGHMAQSPKAPQGRPFKKSDDGSVEEISEEEYKQFQEFKKSQAQVAANKAKEEELRKAEAVRKESEDLIKSAVAQATSKLAKENEELRKSFQETNALIKAMASQPMPSKSITNIQALEKSQRPEDKGQETFSKSEVLDAAFELAKAGKINSNVVSEIEMTNRTSDSEARAKIEKFLESKN